MVSGCSSLVRYLLHSIAFLHLMRKMKNLSRGALSSAFTSGQSMPWFHSDQLSRLQCPPARGGNEALFVGSRKDSPFGSNTQSAVRSPQSAVRSPQSAVRRPQSALRSLCFILTGPVLHVTEGDTRHIFQGLKIVFQYGLGFLIFSFTVYFFRIWHLLGSFLKVRNNKEEIVFKEFFSIFGLCSLLLADQYCTTVINMSMGLVPLKNQASLNKYFFHNFRRSFSSLLKGGSPVEGLIATSIMHCDVKY